MRRLVLAIVVLPVLAAALAAAGDQGQDPARLFKAALDLEMIDRNLPAAIEQYKKVVAVGDRTLVARALLRMAECYERLGSQEAQKIYSQLTSNYADQKDVAAQAQAKLASSRSQVSAAESVFPTSEPRIPWTGSALSPDGRSIVYAVNGPQQGVVHVVDVQTGADRTVARVPCRVIGFGEFNVSNWAPDSRAFAFGCLQETQMRRFQLRVLTMNSGQMQTLDQSTDDERHTLGYRFSWSRDGQRLLFVRRRNPNFNRRPDEMHMANLATGATTAIGATTEGEYADFAWSPDGRQVAFHAVDRDAGRDEFTVLTVSNGELTPVPYPSFTSTATRHLMEWTTTDELVVLETGRVGQTPQHSRSEVALVSVRGGAVRKVCGADRGPSGQWPCGANWGKAIVTPDAKGMIVHDARTRRLSVRDVAAGTDRPLTVGAGDEVFGALSSDGRLVSFASNRDGRWALYVVPLERVPLVKPLQIARLALGEAPENLRVQWASGVLMAGLDGTDYRLYKVALDPKTGAASGPAVHLNTDGRNKVLAAISPDSRRIATWSRDGVKSGIAVIDANGAGERLVLEHRLMSAIGGVPLAWTSPEELVFYDWTRDSNPAGLVAIDVNRGTARAVERGQSFGSSLSPRWSFGLGRRTVVYDEFHSGPPVQHGLRLRSLDTGADQVLLSGRGDQSVDTWVMSADGTQLAYVTTPYVDPVKGQMSAQARVVNSDGSANRALAIANVGSVCQWSPDGRLLLYTARDEYRVANLESGGTSPLLREGDPLARQIAPLCGFQSTAVWAPDGSFVVLTTRQERSSWTMFQSVTYESVVRAMDHAR